MFESGPRVCYYNSATMVCQWFISDFTIVNLLVVDYQTVKINHYEISDRHPDTTATAFGVVSSDFRVNFVTSAFCFWLLLVCITLLG